MSQQIADRVSALSTSRTPFVKATVVRAQAPTSVRPGDDAVVLPDGTLEGFVGGQCTQNSVRTAALAALKEGNATLLRVLPDGAAEFPATPGAQVVVNPCLSGGAIEVFLEPVLPPAVVAVTGSTPIAAAVRSAVTFLGYAVAADSETAFAADDLAGCAAVVLASHGPGEAETLRAALDAAVPYIAVVASRRRAAGLFDDMGLTEAERARVHSPAGLWIGARTAPEIALSIMAEVVASVRGLDRVVSADAPVAEKTSSAKPARTKRPPREKPAAAKDISAVAVLAPVQAVDPVCGMTVTVMPDTLHLAVDGVDYYFCNPGCRKHFARERAIAL